MLTQIVCDDSGLYNQGNTDTRACIHPPFRNPQRQFNFLSAYIIWRLWTLNTCVASVIQRNLVGVLLNIKLQNIQPPQSQRNLIQKVY